MGIKTDIFFLILTLSSAGYFPLVVLLWYQGAGSGTLHVQTAELDPPISPG